MRRMKNRPGAILVLASFAVVTLVIMLAFVVDLSRMFVQKNELQTASDAAAIAGALQLSTATTMVADSAVATGNRNKVLNRATAFSLDSVQCGVWDDSVLTRLPSQWRSGSPHTGACVAGDNAVQVRGSDPASYLFGSILNAANRQVGTVAAAWTAPTVTTTTCIKPFAVDYKYLVRALDAARSVPYDSTQHAVAYRDLQDADFPFLRSTTNALTFCLKDGSTNGPSCPNSYLSSGSFGEADLNPGNGNSTQQYKNLITNVCDDVVPIGPGALVAVKTGNSPVPTDNSLQTWCDYLSPNSCLVKFVMYDPTIPIPPAPNDRATNNSSCSGGSSGSTVCYTVKIIGAGIVDRPHNGDKSVTGSFTVANDPAGAIGTTRGLLQRVVLVK